MRSGRRGHSHVFLAHYLFFYTFNLSLRNANYHYVFRAEPVGHQQNSQISCVYFPRTRIQFRVAKCQSV